MKAESRFGGRVNDVGTKRGRAWARAVVAVAAVSLLTGCTGVSIGQAESGTPAAAQASPAPATPSGPTATVIAVTPAPGASPIPSKPSVPAGSALSMEEMDDARLAMDRFLATAWDTMEPKRLGDVSIADCLYFDKDYRTKTTALFTVDCATPHEGEVMAIYQHPGSEYHGQGDLDGIAGPVFSEAADVMRQAGQLPTDARRDLMPTEADWETGERTSIGLLLGNNSFELLERGYFDPGHAKVYDVPDYGPAGRQIPAGGA